MDTRQPSSLSSPWLVLFVLSVASPCYGDLAFVLTDVGGAATGTAAGDGFAAAAGQWTNLLGDNFTVRLDVEFAPLPSSVVGQTSLPFVVVAPYGLEFGIRDALIADRTSGSDFVAAAKLPPADGGLKFLTNDAVTGDRFFDQDNSLNNRWLILTLANAKALGAVIPPFTDAAITMNSLLPWDFDRSDGIAAGKLDFEGAVAHEIAHSLGFASGVDSVDIVSKPGGPLAPIDLNDFVVYFPLDLFRYSKEEAPGGGKPPWVGRKKGPHVADLAYGGSPFFSINAGPRDLAAFSTGAFNGDGFQASHWKDSLGIGILDPTIGLGELLEISALDVLALDVTGYDVNFPNPLGVGDDGAILDLRDNDQDGTLQTILTVPGSIGVVAGHTHMVVPEPATVSLLLLGIGLLACYLRCFRRKG